LTSFPSEATFDAKRGAIQLKKIDSPQCAVIQSIQNAKQHGRFVEGIGHFQVIENLQEILKARGIVGHKDNALLVGCEGQRLAWRTALRIAAVSSSAVNSRPPAATTL
jgi:hypothetical protein